MSFQAGRAVSASAALQKNASSKPQIVNSAFILETQYKVSSMQGGPKLPKRDTEVFLTEIDSLFGFVNRDLAVRLLVEPFANLEILNALSCAP